MNYRSLWRKFRRNLDRGRYGLRVTVPHTVFPEPCPHFMDLPVRPRETDLFNGCFYRKHEDGTVTWVTACSEMRGTSGEGEPYAQDEDRVWFVRARRGVPDRLGLPQSLEWNTPADPGFGWILEVAQRYRLYDLWTRNYLRGWDLQWGDTPLGQALLDAGFISGDNGAWARATPTHVLLEFGVKRSRSRETKLDFVRAVRRLAEECQRRGYTVRAR